MKVLILTHKECGGVIYQVEVNPLFHGGRAEDLQCSRCTELITVLNTSNEWRAYPEPN